jgi:hypothetical protein
VKVAVYTLCYNESFMLPFYMQHYRPLVDRIVLYDNGSTDGSRELALSLGADEVRPLDTENQIRDDLTLGMRNGAWKELREQGYDWVMWVDMDEFVYHPDLRAHLERCAACNATICIPQGYQMVGDQLPTHDRPLFEQIPNGTYCNRFSKPVIFNPNAIAEMNFVPGAHRALPTGFVHPDVAPALKLMHYHWLCLNWVVERNKWRAERLSNINKQNGWGAEYLAVQHEAFRVYHKLKLGSFPVIPHQEARDVMDKMAAARRKKIEPPPQKKKKGKIIRKHHSVRGKAKRR